jgi:hypothetical protein
MNIMTQANMVTNTLMFNPRSKDVEEARRNAVPNREPTIIVCEYRRTSEPWYGEPYPPVLNSNDDNLSNWKNDYKTLTGKGAMVVKKLRMAALIATIKALKCTSQAQAASVHE